MNILKVKSDLEKIKNKKVKIKVNVGRNKYEYYEGFVHEFYPNIFTIKLENEVKSFSYSDILTKSVIISLF